VSNVPEGFSVFLIRTVIAHRRDPVMLGVGAIPSATLIHLLEGLGTQLLNAQGALLCLSELGLHDVDFAAGSLAAPLFGGLLPRFFLAGCLLCPV